MPGVGTTHHVLLDGHYYLVKPGSYTKRVAPQFGARFTTGDPDFNNLSIWQHWAQRCFVGGMDAPEWSDDAMYDDGVGLNTADHEKVTLSRDLARGSGSNWAVSSGTFGVVGYQTCVYSGALYVLAKAPAGTESELWKYDPSTDGWTRITSLDAQNMTSLSIAAFDGKLFIGGCSVGTTTGKLIYGTGTLAAWTTVTNPAGLSTTSTITAMRSFQSKFYVAFHHMVFRMKDDQTWDGNTVFYKTNLNSESNGVAAMETHLGFLYMLSQNGHIHRTDGNQTFDIWSWDGQTIGVALRSFDGRLFAITYEYTNTADVGFGVLYQMSGSAMTELKRWGKENQSNIIGSLTVYDRKLFYGASNLLGMTSREGFGVAMYDPVEDSHSIIASNSATGTYAKGSIPYRNYIVENVTFFGGYMFAFVRGHGAFKTPYRNLKRDIRDGIAKFDTTTAGGGLTSTNGGWLTTSTYDAGTPGLRKLWQKIVVEYSLPSANTGIVVDYSLDDGTSWTTAGTITATGTRLRAEFKLNNKVSTSLKLRFTLRSTVSTQTPVFYGFVVSYLPEPEPNWMWDFTIVLSEKQVLLDGTEATVNTESELAFLNSAYRNKLLLSFTDAEGQVWADDGPGVLIYDMRVWLPDLTQPLEGEVIVTLLEAVETY